MNRLSMAPVLPVEFSYAELDALRLLVRAAQHGERVVRAHGHRDVLEGIARKLDAALLQEGKPP